MTAARAENRRDRRVAVLAHPFRVFFLLTALYGTIVIAAWGAFWLGAIPLALGPNPLQWHAHEMLFGMVPAAIAGFLLTAMCNWTGAQPLRGAGLLILAAVWLAGRVSMWSAAALPMGLVAAVDLAFLPAVAGYAGWVLARHGNRRNLPLVAVLGLLAAANAMMHMSFLGWYPGAGRVGEVMAIEVIAVLMVVIGGRIIPTFTANWLQARGGARVHEPRWLAQIGVLAMVLLMGADTLGAAPQWGAALALAAAFCNGWRLVCWRGWAAAADPLVWILHVGFGWIVLALTLRGLTPWLGLDPTVWMHAMGAGAMGTLIIGVMTRVSLGHAGRALRLPRLALWSYAAVLLAGAVRVAVAPVPSWAAVGIGVSALAWAAAFGLFLIIYWPILSRPRVDGRPG